MKYPIADEILLKTGDEAHFNFEFGAPVGAGLAKSKEEMIAFIGGLKDLDFRVTPVGETYVQIWVNHQQYVEYFTEKSETADKKSMDEFLKLLPILVVVFTVGSVVLSAIVALQVQTNSLFYPGLGVVNFWTAFVRMLAVCGGVSLLTIVWALLNKGKVN